MLLHWLKLQLAYLHWIVMHRGISLTSALSSCLKAPGGFHTAKAVLWHELRYSHGCRLQQWIWCEGAPVLYQESAMWLGLHHLSSVSSDVGAMRLLPFQKDWGRVTWHVSCKRFTFGVKPATALFEWPTRLTKEQPASHRTQCDSRCSDYLFYNLFIYINGSFTHFWCLYNI